MKSKFKKLLATALVLCLVLALLPAAAFAEGPYKVTFVNNEGNVPSNGTLTVNNVVLKKDGPTSTQIAAETEVTVTANPNEGYGVLSISADVEWTKSGESYTFNMPEKDVKITVQFMPYNNIVTDTNITGGRVTCQKEAMYTDTVTITATPDPGYELKAFEVYHGNQKYTTTIVNNTATFQMPNNDVTVSAEFEAKQTHKITVISNGTVQGAVTTEPSGSTYAGDTVYLKTTVTGVQIKSVEIYGTDDPSKTVQYNEDAGTFTMPAYDVTVSVEFEPFTPPVTDTYTIITADNITGGSVDSLYQNTAQAGDTVYIKVDPDLYYKTKCVYYTTSEGAGIIVPWKQYLTHEYWLDTQSYEVWSFVMPNHGVYVYADFTYYDDYGTHYIDTSYDSTLGGVEVWVNNNYVGNNWHQGSWADHNDTVSFKVKPYYSDDVVSVSVVGKRTGWTYSYDYNSYSGWYTFSMPSEDVTINVDFRSGVHKVYVDKVTDGKLTVSDDWAKYGQIVYITAVPDYGCTLSSLSVRTATGDSVRVYNAQKADTYYFYMPDQYVSVSAVFTGKYTSLPFNDVSYGDWYYDAVQFVYSKGIMDGVDYYKFAPNGTITRGMIVTMLWRMAGEPFEMPVTSFTDVEIGRYYTTAVAWACRNGIADGMGETKFGPNDAITREELVTLMYRYAQYFGHSCIGTSIEGFADAGSVSSYAYNAMCWAYKAGVVTGTTGSRLNPQGTASRAEAAQMIMSFYSFLNS